MDAVGSWEVILNLATPHRTHLVPVRLDPLPSGLAQAVVAVRVPKAVPRQRRLLRLFEKDVPRRALAGWREAKGWRDGRWWVAGPWPYPGAVLASILRILSTNPTLLHQRWQERHVILVDPRTGQELPLPPEKTTPLEPDLGDEEADTHPLEVRVEEGPVFPEPSPRARAIIQSARGAENLSDADRATMEGFAEYLLQKAEKKKRPPA